MAKKEASPAPIRIASYPPDDLNDHPEQVDQIADYHQRNPVTVIGGEPVDVADPAPVEEPDAPSEDDEG